MAAVVQEQSLYDWNKKILKKRDIRKHGQENMINEQYKIMSLSGEGGTARVYRVWDEENHKICAVKVSSDKPLLKKESNLLKRLKSNRFTEWFDYFETDTEGFLVMEYIEGRNLQTVLEEAMILTFEQKIKIIVQILEGLQYLHIQNPPIIYKDMKPANIMVSDSGEVRLIDLGSAVDGKFRTGTYGYAAPEQFWVGVKPEPQSDIYAVGKILAYLLTGKSPWEPPYDILEYCRQNKSVSNEMFRVLQRSLAVESAGRYPSAEEFIREISIAYESSGRKKHYFSFHKQQIVYEKCIWKSEYQRIF